MPKNAYVLEKSCKIAIASGSAPKHTLAFDGWRVRPQTPELLFPLIDIHLTKCIFYH